MSQKYNGSSSAIYIRPEICFENTPGSAGIPACMLSSTAARMTALPGTFSLLCMSFAHDNCSENTPWERRHPCLHAFMYCGQDGRAPGYIFIIVCEVVMESVLKITPGSAGILACMLSSTAARMAALPGTFSSSCVSVAHDNCSRPWRLTNAFCATITVPAINNSRTGQPYLDP